MLDLNELATEAQRVAGPTVAQRRALHRMGCSTRWLKRITQEHASRSIQIRIKKYAYLQKLKKWKKLGQELLAQRDTSPASA
jgi:hypothetical protein